jgi:hypothetical protein
MADDRSWNGARSAAVKAGDDGIDAFASACQRC